MKSSAFLILALLAPLGGWGQVAVEVSGEGVKVQAGGKRNVVANRTGAVDSDVQMEGVATINGAVFIDGEEVPRGKTMFTGKKSGRVYLIKWGRDGNVAVQEK